MSSGIQIFNAFVSALNAAVNAVAADLQELERRRALDASAAAAQGENDEKVE